MTRLTLSSKRVLRGLRDEPADRVPVPPRLWKFTRLHDGEHTPDTTFRAVEEFGHDPVFYTGGSVASFLSAIPAPEALRPGVTCEGDIEKGEEFDIVHRQFQTPAGPLSDAWQRPHPDKG